MAVKPKIAFTWCSSCGGCEESVIDLSEALQDLSKRVDIAFWPVALDSRRKDLEVLRDGELDLSFINGAVRLTEHVEMAKLLRLKSKVVVAHGTCAHLGGIVGLGNFYSGRDLLAQAFVEASTVKNPLSILPGVSMEDGGIVPDLSPLVDRVMTLDQVVEVDYYIPGCPPPPELVSKALGTLLETRLPEKGLVFGERRALCHTCPRRESRPDTIKVKAFKRLYEARWDSEKCFLPQGIICLGPATRGGCGNRCIQANMPCRGCFGPLDNVEDHGAAMVSFIASMIDGECEKEIRSVTDSIPDPGGLFYRYSAAHSILGRGKRAKS